MRRAVLAVLLLGYAAVFIRLPRLDSSASFEALSPRGREVERAIEERRFADALPVARELAGAYPNEAVIAYWLAEIHDGLGQAGDAAAAWEHVFELTKLADAACPALPRAYARVPDAAKSLDAYERCAAAASDDAERWFDLGEAFASNNRPEDAARAFEKSRALDPSNPRLPRVSLTASVLGARARADGGGSDK